MALDPQHCQWRMPASGRSFSLQSAYLPPAPANKIFLRFAEKLIKALKGEKGIVEPTFVYLPGVPGGEAIAKETGVDFFSVPVELGVCLASFETWRVFRSPLTR
jgi:hypothetical protein